MTRERSSSFYGGCRDEEDETDSPTQKINFLGLVNMNDSHLLACILSAINVAHQRIINSKPVTYAYEYLNPPSPRVVTKDGNTTDTEFKVRVNKIHLA